MFKLKYNTLSVDTPILKYDVNTTISRSRMCGAIHDTTRLVTIAKVVVTISVRRIHGGRSDGVHNIGNKRCMSVELPSTTC